MSQTHRSRSGSDGAGVARSARQASSKGCRGALLRLGAIALALAAMPAAHAVPIEATRLFDREMDIYYGTWDVFLLPDDPSPFASYTFVELTDHISAGFRTHIEYDGAVDPRVGPALPPWVNPLQTNIEWVIAPPENLPATANFDALIAALGGTIAADSGYSPVGTRSYLLDSFDSTETAPITVGDTDQPESVGNDGDTVSVTNNFAAEVRYLERNGRVIRPVAVPEPGTLAMLGVGLLGLALARRRTAFPPAPWRGARTDRGCRRAPS